MMKDRFKLYQQPKLEKSPMIISWSEDAGKLGPMVCDYLIEKTGAEIFCHIEPLHFFSLGGVTIKNDLIHFPRSEFYASEKHDLLIFKSDVPGSEWFEFLNLVLDIAENYCGVKELYTMGGIISMIPHTYQRKILAVVNRPGLKKALTGYDLALDMDYQTAPGGRPTLSSFILWAAKRRNISGVSLWGEVAFYLSAAEDSKAAKTMLEFLNKRFKLAVDLAEITLQLEKQEDTIHRMKAENPEIAEYIGRLENGEHLTQDESERLLREIDDLLKQRQ